MAITTRDYATPTGIIMIINEDIRSTTPINGNKLNPILVGIVQQIEAIPTGVGGSGDTTIDDTL